MSERMTISDAREAISTTRFKLFQKVKTPFGKGRVQYYLLDRGELQLVVSQTDKSIIKGECEEGETKMWILRFLDPNEVEIVKEE
jgi:hypothetical protein